MRIKTHRQGGHESGGLALGGGKMSGPLTLFRDPVEDLEAVTKQYVDNIPNNMDASALKTGILRDDMLPALSGDVSTVAGERVISITNEMVPGNYTNVTVNNKGLVTGGGLLSENDVPGLSWNKFTKEMPSDLAGYGILDGISTKGDVLEGYLILEDNPVLDEEISSKTHTDGLFPIVEGDRLKIGDIIQKATGVTPANFLKCNDGVVDKGLYADLYAVIGDRFKREVRPGAGKPWVNQYDFNEATGIGAWVKDTNLPISNDHHQLVITKNRLYMIGKSNTVYYAPILEDGSLGIWVKDTNLPIAISGHQCVVTKNRLYMIGGGNTVYHTPILEDGSLGTWVQDANLPVIRGVPQCVVTKDRLYLVGGGVSNSGSNTVYYAPILEDGSLGIWVQDTNLPIPNFHFQCVVIKNRLYMLGGSSGPGTHNTVYYAPILEDGSLGTWVQYTNLPIANHAQQCVVTKNRLYMIAGGIGVNSLNTVYYAPILEDGSLGTWVQDTNLPIHARVHRCVVTKNRLYMIGGIVGSNSLNTVYYAPLVIPASKQGGKNDYSEYYNQTHYETLPVGKFRLPNYSLEDRTDFKHYIKYS